MLMTAYGSTWVSGSMDSDVSELSLNDDRGRALMAISYVPVKKA